MIYTFGNTENYDKKLTEFRRGLSGLCLKKGRTDSHPGGTVFATMWEAYRAIASHGSRPPRFYSVYSVDAVWERDTTASGGLRPPAHNLLVDAQIVEKVC